MDEQRAWLRLKRKRRLRTLALVLSFCVLLTSSPHIWEAVFVFAAEESNGEDSENSGGGVETSGDFEDGADQGTDGEGIESDDGEDVSEGNEPDGGENDGEEEPDGGENDDEEEPDSGEEEPGDESDEEESDGEETGGDKESDNGDHSPEEEPDDSEGGESIDEQGGSDEMVQELLARIAALPEAEEILAKEPEAEDEAAYEEWTAELSVYGEEAFTILEAYDELTEEQQAQIPGEAVAKLMAWVELADMITGGRETYALGDSSGDCGGAGYESAVKWKHNSYSGKFRIEGNGPMADYASGSDAPWKKKINPAEVHDFTIGSGITHIGNNAFAGVTWVVNSVTIPATVSSIGTGAFPQSNYLEAFIMEGTDIIPELGEHCFSSDCTITIENCSYYDVYCNAPGWSAYKDNIRKRHKPEDRESISAKEPTCMETGNKAYWRCKSCWDLFADEYETIPTTLEDVTLPINADNHSYTYSASGAVITESCANGCGHSATATLSVNSGANLAYTGSAIKPVTVTYSENWGGTGTDYKPNDARISYSNNTNVGTAKAELTIGGVTAAVDFRITEGDMTGVTASGYTGAYDGDSHSITVNAPAGATVAYGINEGTYQLPLNPSYTTVGTRTVYYQVTKSNYKPVRGSAQVTIKPRDINGAVVTLDSTTLTYNGSAQTKGVSKVTLTVGAKTLTLTEGRDYTVSGNERTDAGTHTITISATNYNNSNYTGTKTITFTIASKPLADSMVTVAAGPHYYTGNAVTPAVTVKDGSRTLTVGTDYTVSYEDNINAGTAKATVTGKGNYTGTASQTFTIQYGPLPAGKKLTDYVTVGPAPTDGWYDAEITLTPKSGCGVGETSSGIGSTGVTVSGETGADGTTKTIYVKDETGKIYQTEFTYKLDKTPPVIDLSNMSVTNGTKGLWNWIIGKKSMIIRIPETGITDALSGVKEVAYTAVSDSGAEQTRTIQVQGGSYDISMNAEFSGTIKLTAKDKAGNSTEVSLTAAGGKVIAEDYAPIVKMTLPVTPQPNKDGWYNTTVSVNVAVTDDKNADNTGILSGGIAAIVWKDGENGAEQPVAGLPGASPVYEKEFTISVSTDGAHTYYVKAVDNAGNESGWRTIAVKRDTGNPVFTKAPEAGNHTQAGTDITFTPSEGGKAYWLVNPETTPAAQEVVRKGAQNNCVKESMTGGSPNSFKVTGLTPGKTHTVYVVLEDAAGNLSEVKAVSISIDKYILTDSQMNLSVSGWTYGAQEKPVPRGSVSVADANPVITWLYSADSGVSWTDAERLPKSDSGHILPGTYQVKMTYTGDGYKGTKTAVFTVEKRLLTVEKGTLEAEDKNYDKMLTAALKEGGAPMLSGVLTGDMVSLGGALRAEFVEAGPKKNIAVTVTGFELEGRDAGYYVIGNTSITLQATVNKADGTPPDEKKPESGDHDKDTDKDKDKDKDKGSGGGENSGGTNDNSDSTGNGGEAGNNDGADNGGSPTPVVSPKSPEKPSDMPVPAETDRSAPEQKNPETGGNSGREPGAQEQTQRQGDGENRDAAIDAEKEQDTTVTDNGGQTDSGTVRSVAAAADQGRIVVSGEKVPTGNVAGMEQASTAMMVGNGAVFVTVVCEDEKYAAGVNDAAAVANAVLSSEQVQLVNDGGTIEIRVDVKDISEKIPQQDQEVIKNGLVEYQKEVPNLMLGRYIDISMFMKIGESDWDAITSTEEPIEVVIGVPEDMREDGREFYIIRAHEGEHTFMHDLDEEPDTITISTDMFSSYAIAYVAAGSGNGGSVCGLCHICPTFLGVCCFIWLAVVTVVILFTAAVILRRKRKGKQTA